MGQPGPGSSLHADIGRTPPDYSTSMAGDSFLSNATTLLLAERVLLRPL